VIGHSEGALIGAIAARIGKADGFVSLAGVGSPAEIILKRQLRQAGRSGAGLPMPIRGMLAGGVFNPRDIDEMIGQPVGTTSGGTAGAPSGATGTPSAPGSATPAPGGAGPTSSGQP